jgi:hypothetical protein
MSEEEGKDTQHLPETKIIFSRFMVSDTAVQLRTAHKVQCVLK